MYFCNYSLFLESERTTLRTCISKQEDVNYCQLIGKKITVIQCVVVEYTDPWLGKHHHHHHHHHKNKTSTSATTTAITSIIPETSTTVSPTTFSSSTRYTSSESSDSTQTWSTSATTARNPHASSPKPSSGSVTGPSLKTSISLAILLLPGKFWDFEKILIISLVLLTTIAIVTFSISCYILVVQK